MPDPKDKNKMDSVSSNASEQFGTRVINDAANSTNVEMDAALTAVDEARANKIAIEQQRGRRKPIPSVMDIHKAMMENEAKKQSSPMPATETPDEKAGREAAAAAVKQISAMEQQQNNHLKEKGPAIPTHGHAAAAARNDAIRKRSHHADDRRKHATREQRLEAKANRVFNQSKPSDKKSAIDIFKESAPSGNIPGKRRP